MSQPALRRHGAVQLAAQNRRDGGRGDETGPPNVAPTHWFQPRLDAVRWNKSFPYQLLVLRRLKGGGWEQDDRWQFTLPIPPQELVVSTAFANELLLNEEGAVEICDPIRVRTIRFRGTTGVLPGRPVAEQRPFNIARTIFAGTVNQVNGLGAAATDLARDLVPANYRPTNVMSDADFRDSDVGRTSGYYQMRLLEQFFERYCELKASEEGRDRQLALAIWKDQAVWLISPQSFDIPRAVPKVLQYDYSFQGRAFARVSLDKVQAAYDFPTPISTTPDKLVRALSAIRDSRRVVYQAVQTLRAAVRDVENLVLEPLRETSLLLQELAGAPVALADMPSSLIRAAKSAVLSLLSARDAVQSVPDALLNRIAATGQEVDELRELGALLSRSDTRSGQLNEEGALINFAANEVFESPESHYEFFSGVRVGDLQLRSEALRAVSKERERVRSFTQQDFGRMRAKVELASDAFAGLVGLSHPTYERTLNKPESVASREPIDSDYDVLFALNSAAMVLDSLAAQAPRQVSATELSLQYVAGLASGAGIAFRIPRSKFAVPFPHGSTLEQLASRHLNNPDRWHEIATLNGLREPYVDEVGYYLDILANPSDRRVLVAGEAIPRAGEPVTLLSRAVPALQTRVLRVDQFGSQWMLTLADDASAFLPNDLAVLHAYLPDTANSTQTIWIPSDEEPAEDDFSVRDPASVTDFDPLIRAAGTDLLLNQTGGLVLTPDGDFLYARGLPLVTQVVRTALGTIRGSLLRHPSYGLPEAVGESLADLTAREQAQAIRDTFQDDPLFQSVSGVVVQKGPVMTCSVELGVKGLDRPVPVSVQLVR